jgi:hypothetical protein
MAGVRQYFSGFDAFRGGPPVPCYGRADPVSPRHRSGLLWGEQVTQT